MPLYMDIHNLEEGTTPEDVAKAHAKDMETQRKYGVEYTKYWVNDTGRKVFCLAHAPSAEAAEQVHREAHGMIPEKIIEVEPDVAEVFLGGTETNPAGAVILPGGGANDRDPGIRTILFTDIVNSTTLTQSLGDEAALVLVGVHDTIVRDALSALGGREVKHTGDGIMASFVSAASAVRCAIQIQRELDKHAQTNPERCLKVRVGAAAGEPVEQNNDLFGSTVQPRSSPVCSRAAGTDSRFERNSRSVYRERAVVRRTWRSCSQRLRLPSPRSCRCMEVSGCIEAELACEIFASSYKVYVTAVSMPKESPTDYTVNFSNEVARVINYEDAAGRIEFTLDSSDKGNHWVVLEHHHPGWPRGRRYDIAFQRTKQFLESCGFGVEIYGE